MAKPSILLVDDDPVFVDAMTAVLSQRYDTRSAADGEEAMARLIGHSSPQRLARKISEGYDLAATLKKDPETAGIPIIMLTGVNRVFEIRSRLEKGWVDVEGFHTKPPEFDKLFETIEKHIHSTASVG